MHNKLATSATSDKSIDFTTDKGDGLFSIQKNESLSTPIYYYRGNVNNNYVVFAGFCWRMVRTTDTGGIKLLYNGDTTCKNEGYNLLIGNNQYSNNNQTKYKDSQFILL